jgi:hypothetical protein
VKARKQGQEWSKCKDRCLALFWKFWIATNWVDTTRRTVTPPFPLRSAGKVEGQTAEVERGLLRRDELGEDGHTVAHLVEYHKALQTKYISPIPGF